MLSFIYLPCRSSSFKGNFFLLRLMTSKVYCDISDAQSRVSVSTKLRTLQMQGSRSNRSISRASVVTIENKRGLYFSSNFMSLIARSGSRKLQLDNSTNSLTPINFLHKLESLNNSNANNESLREDGSSLLDMLMLQLDAVGCLFVFLLTLFQYY